MMLLDGKKVITWSQLEEMIAALPDPSLAYPAFKITRGVHGAEKYQAVKDRIWALHRKFQLKGHSEGSLWPRADPWYDRIETSEDLMPDESLRVEGRVVDQHGKAVDAAEVILRNPGAA